MPAHEHVVQFYDRDAFLIETVTTYVVGGLRAAQPVLVVMTPPHREALIARLAVMGVDAGVHVESGELMLLDAEQMLAKFMVEGAPDRARFSASVAVAVKAAVARGPSGHMRAYGEMVDCLWRAGNASAAIALEGLWNELGAQCSFSLLCGYGMDNFRDQPDGGGFEAVCHAHSRTVPTEAYLGLDSDDRRMREVSVLQQRARALENEVGRRLATERELREAVNARDEFLNAAGHELRTPLTVLRLQLASMLSRQGDGGDPRTEARLSLMVSQIERLARMAERLVDVAQLGEQVTLHRRAVDLAVLVQNGLAAQEKAASGADCLVTVKGDAAVMGRWDPDRLEQVIEELLANAFKFGRGEPVEVTVQGRAEHAELVIQDGGIGVAAGDRERIFDRGVRPASIEKFGGLGLGLWIVRRIVEAHGGTITADSSAGRGATVVLRLPYDPAP
ncbi:MAG TPA: ATP-binding protein [Polyangia bacterium]|nr:ATP-binding protein [Polyangia bacterium]